MSKYYSPITVRENQHPLMKHKGNTNPPGRQRIIEALTQLMWTKDFNSVTTAEIAEQAGVTEGLIYKYFPGGKFEYLILKLRTRMDNLIRV